jgi:hypothetical protein
MDYTTLRVLMERQAVSLEKLTADVQEIKKALPHNGEERLQRVEDSVHSLNRWKYGIVSVGTFIVGLLGFMKDKQ